MSTKFKVRESEWYPVYTRYAGGYEVEVEDDLEQEYFEALDKFEDVLYRMEDAISSQIEAQKYPKRN